MPDPLSPILDRLRSNLRAAGIRFDEREIEAMAAGRALDFVVAFEDLDARIPRDEILADFSHPAPNTTTHTAPGPGPSANTSSAPPANDDTIAALAPRLRSREISPVELTRQSLARIESRDATINAFQLVLPERALGAAERAEREIASGDYRGPLHGIPIAIKDLLDLAGMPTTAGSKVLADRVADRNATAVDRLEAAGAVIVGKTRMPEFAYWPGSSNPHYGPTRNPRNEAHDTGGSSSGSAAAVAAGMVIAAIGSDTGGSIRIPSAQCGLVGLKPTFGRASLDGAVTLAWSLDHLGPMTRSAEDAALVLEAIAGPDPRDPRTRDSRAFSAASALANGDARGLRIGVIKNVENVKPVPSAEAMSAWRAGLAALESAGARLVEVDFPVLTDLRVANSAILALESMSFHHATFRERPGDLGAIFRERMLAAFAYGPTAYPRARQAASFGRRTLLAHFERVDMISTPSMPGVAPLLDQPGPTTYAAPFNILGWPAITSPVAVGAGGLPLGIQLIARPWGEATVLRAARAIELPIGAKRPQPA